MKCQALLFIIISLVHAAQGKMSYLNMIMPRNVLMNDDIHGKCATTDVRPHIVIKRTSECNFKIEKQRRIVVQDNITLYCTDFVIKNVTATCEYICAAKQHRVTQTVVVSDAMILPMPLNITTFENMPVKLRCTVKTNVQSKYKLIWMKGDEFVTGNGYSIESTPFDSNNNTQNHFLTIHKASPGDYTCMLISTTRKIIDSKTQHVATESNPMVSLLLKDLNQFLKWN